MQTIHANPARTPHEDYDGAWKDILNDYFQPFVQLCLPQIYDVIDWTQPYQSLDQELQTILPRNPSKKRIIDKLMKVWRHGGQILYVLIHLEIQTQKDDALPERLFTSHYRIFDRYHQPIMSVAVLSDLQADWRPDYYEHQQWGTRLRFDFVNVKLLDYELPQSEWENHANPIMILIQAHLQSLKTQNKAHQRLQSKLALTRLICKTLHQRGLEKTDIFKLLRFIEWLMALPEPLVLEYHQTIQQWEDADMTFVTSFERYAREEGIQQGELTMLHYQLQSRFGSLSPLHEQYLQQASEEQLLEWGKRILQATTINDVFQD